MSVLFINLTEITQELFHKHLGLHGGVLLLSYFLIRKSVIRPLSLEGSPGCSGPRAFCCFAFVVVNFTLVIYFRKRLGEKEITLNSSRKMCFINLHFVYVGFINCC